MNQYVTIRMVCPGTLYEDFYVNVIKYDGRVATFGQSKYAHKRSARRAAKALALKLDISYRQDLEYSNKPYAFVAAAIA